MSGTKVENNTFLFLTGNRNNQSTAAPKEPTIEDDFPSLKEAAEMARGIRLEQKQVKTKPKPSKWTFLNPHIKKNIKKKLICLSLTL